MRPKKMLKLGGALLFSGVAAIAVAADSPLVGKWEWVAHSHGGLGTTLELRADGTLTSTIGAMVDTPYRVEHDILITSHKNPTTGKPQEARIFIRFEQDTLVQRAANNPKAHEIRMKRERAGKPGDPPIVGTWSSNGTALTTFTSDGRKIFRNPVKTTSGKWSVSGDQLILTYEERPSQTAAYKLDNDVLSIESKNGEPVKYRRATDSTPAR